MSRGLIPAQGRWIQRTWDITAASTFSEGDALGITTLGQVSLYSGGAGNFLGIATHRSADSLPAGKVVFEAPAGAGCTVMVNVPTGVAASALSFGETFGIYAVGGSTSFLTKSYTSTTGRPFTIVGAISLSPTSRIEAAIKYDAVVYGSALSSLLV